MRDTRPSRPGGAARLAAARLAATLAAAALPGHAMAGPQAAWPATIPDLAPALRACLLHAGKGAYATAADTAPDGTVLVTLWHAGIATLCQAASAGGDVLAWRPLAGRAPPDPAAPAFFLERRCADARRIEAPGAGVLGWLAYPAC